MRGIRQFSLIEEGDHVLIGLSGGKDSLALLEFLGAAQKRAGGRFRLSALHVRMDNIDYQSDTSYLLHQASDAGVPLRIASAHFDPDTKEHRTPCFLCSWTRRKTFFNIAQELDCNKIALGHHQDDILKTALMNLTFTGSFSTMPARLRLRKMPLTIVRPLCLVEETDLQRWAQLRQYEPLKKVCPFDHASNRTAIAEPFAALETLNPDFRHSLWHALLKSGALVEE